jgi:hypothetical protein
MGLIYALSSLPRGDRRAFRKNVLVTYYVKTMRNSTLTGFTDINYVAESTTIQRIN